MKTKKRKDAARQEKARSEFWLWPIGLVFAIFAVFQVYGPALHGPFVFDDLSLPMNVPAWSHGSLLESLGRVRPLLMASYWVNSRLGGADTTQYHVWNVFFHFLNALLVYFITRKLLEFAGAPQNLALFAGALFLLHPLATESVAYVAGRSDGMSSAFFLGAFALFLYRRSREVSWLVALGVLALFGAAMATKENTVVLPALLLLTDYFWNPGFSFEGIRRNWRLYAPMVAGAIVGAVAVLRLVGISASAGFRTMPWYEYLFTQFRVVFVYLKLFLLPTGLTVDYDFPISHSILDQGAIFGLIGILALLAAAVYFRRRYPLACFGLLVFVILLAPTSSVLPIKDPISERRAYLPMIGLLLILLDAIRRLRVGRTALATSLSAVLFIASALTYQRNIAWSGTIPLWEDAVKKSPRKARAHFQLAMAYYGVNRCQDAEEHFQTVAQLEKPDYHLLLDWALADFCLNKTDEALQKFQQAAALERTAHVYTQIAMVHAKTGKIAESFQALAEAEKIDPHFEVIYVYRGQLFASANNPAAAAEQYRRALSINPRNEQAIEGLQRISR
jgi:tetratricopeptide (TPR) repeat protein